MKELLTCFILAVLVNQAHSACSATLGDVTAELASLANISTADPTAAYDGLNQTCSSLNKKRNSSDCTWEELDALIDIRIHLLTARPELQGMTPPCYKTTAVKNCTFADGLYREVANISYICHLPDTLPGSFQTCRKENV
ncbi:hypothetical protein MAR_013474 [Mya arenaria]|uniref:Uncharacterized protein n=1 Tax=Mya arenaria TaxID=6604 RepID=A0ABY7G022_MYAAR|nr:hypothetical protein MAR_013474 [Mya arenaria]